MKTKDIEVATHEANVKRLMADEAARKVQKEFNGLRDKLQEMPYMVEKAKSFVKHNYSDKYIQSMLYASRSPNIGIDDIVDAIAEARVECNIFEKEIV